MYDWANSAFQSTVIIAVFPPFFSSYAAAGLTPAEATARFAWATTFAVTIVALLGPILGAVADYRAVKKRLLAVFMAIGVVATLLMATIERGDWTYAAIAVRRRQHRRRGEPGVLRLAAAAHRGARARSTACRPPATRSASSAAACCCS